MGSHKTLRDYAQFLIQNYPTFIEELSILFDNPGMLPNTPKQFEQQRRNNATSSNLSHYCDDLTSFTPVHTEKHLSIVEIARESWLNFWVNFFWTEQNLTLPPNRLYMSLMTSYVGMYSTPMVFSQSHD